MKENYHSKVKIFKTNHNKNLLCLNIKRILMLGNFKVPYIKTKIKDMLKSILIAKLKIL